MVITVILALNIALWRSFRSSATSRYSRILIFAAGLMLGCRAIDTGGTLTINHLFAGFNQRAGPLLILGVIYTGLVYMIAIALGATVIGIVRRFSARRS